MTYNLPRVFVKAVLLVFSCSGLLFAQEAHVAGCKVSPKPVTSTNAPVIEKLVAGLGESTVLNSLKAIRYTAEISFGTGVTKTKGEVTLMRVYPDRFVMTTRGPGEAQSYLEASPDSAFVRPLGGTKTDLPESMRVELLKAVRLDFFYVGQNIASGKAKLTNEGTEQVGDVSATKVHVEIQGAEATWYMDGNGRLLRAIHRVPVMGGMADQVVDYLDWRNCDGLMVPFQRRIREGEKISEERVIVVELNPSSQVAPLARQTSVADNNAATPGDSSQVQVPPKPFGFEMGMTKKQIVEKLGRDAIKKENGDVLVLSTAPAPHPAFESYLVVVSPEKGLLKVRANGVTISVNDEGDQLKAEFEKIYDGLATKYGKARRLDFVQGSEVNERSEFWMMTLLKGERTLEAYWNYQDKSGGSTRTGIALEAKALRLNDGYITLLYEFPGWNAYVDTRKAKQDDVF